MSDDIRATTISNDNGNMAEWSKALELGDFPNPIQSQLEARVRTPLLSNNI